MRIAIDIDGVVGDQVPAALKRINRKLGSHFSKKDIRSWNEKLDHTDIEVEIEEALLDESFVLQMPAYRGARAALGSLREAGHYVILATSRPAATHYATEAWLRARQIPHDEVVNTRATGKKALDAEVLVDDNVLNVISFSEPGRPAILFLQPWNQAAELKNALIYRARGWKQARSILDQLS